MSKTLALALLLATAPSPVASAQAHSASSVESLARALSTRVREALPSLPRLSVAIHAQSALPPEAPRAAQLVAALVAPTLEDLRADGRVELVARLDEALAPDEAAREASRRGHHVLISIQVSTRGRALGLRARVTRRARDRIADLVAPGDAQLGVVELGAVELDAPLDAHLLSFVGAPARVGTDTVVARHVLLPSRGYVAMAATDLDGDGRTELYLASASHVDMVRLEPGRRVGVRLRRIASMPLDGISAAPSRARRAFGTAVPEPGRVLFRLSDHASAFMVHLREGRLAWGTVASNCPPEAYPLADACASAVTGRDYFHAELGTREGLAAPARAPSGFYARASDTLRQRDGTLLRFEAIVTPRGRVASRAGEARGGAVGYGAALAMSDLDLDGEPELLTSSAEPVGRGDRLSLLRLRRDGGLVSLWTSEAMEGSVLVAAAADLDDDGAPELLAVEEPARGLEPARLWIVR